MLLTLCPLEMVSSNMPLALAYALNFASLVNTCGTGGGEGAEGRAVCVEGWWEVKVL